MRCDAMALIARGAAALRQTGDPGAAYSLYELANNLRLVMRGEETIEAWNAVYVGGDRDPLDIEKLLPVPSE